jgi:hypothetical protein
LHDRLLTLPTVSRLITVKWVPGKLDARWGSILTSLLSRAIHLTTHAPGSAAEREAHLLLRESARILLWTIPERRGENSQSDTADDTTERSNPAYSATIRRRLQLAEQNQWLQLVDEAIAAELDMDAQTQMQARHERSRTRTYQVAMEKAASGQVRSAVQLLSGLPAVEPGPSTTSAIKALFVTEPLPPPQAIRHSQIVSKARLIPAKVITEDSARRRLFASTLRRILGLLGSAIRTFGRCLRHRKAQKRFASLHSYGATLHSSPLWLEYGPNYELLQFESPPGDCVPLDSARCYSKPRLD